MDAAEKKCRSIVKRIQDARKRGKSGDAIKASATFSAEMDELKRLGMHPAWECQIDAELSGKK